MTTTKIAVTVPEETLASARAAVRRGAAKNLSAYVSAALAQRVMTDDLEALLAEMLEASGGPLSDAERHRIDRMLDNASPRRGRRR